VRARIRTNASTRQEHARAQPHLLHLGVLVGLHSSDASCTSHECQEQALQRDRGLLPFVCPWRLQIATSDRFLKVCFEPMYVHVLGPGVDDASIRTRLTASRIRSPSILRYVTANLQACHVPGPQNSAAGEVVLVACHTGNVLVQGSQERPAHKHFLWALARCWPRC